MYIVNNFNIINFNQIKQNKQICPLSKPNFSEADKFIKTPLYADQLTFSGTNKIKVDIPKGQASRYIQKPDCKTIKKQAAEPKILYDNERTWNINKIIFPKPITLKEVSEFLLRSDILEQICFDKWEIEDIENSFLADVKIKELLGHGTAACAFLMEDGNVLKLSCGKHLRREHEDFDIPIYESGNFLSICSEDIYYYIEPYASSEEVSYEEMLELANKMIAKGYELVDISYDSEMKKFCKEQFGKTSDGKVYLLDPECAQIKTSYSFDPFNVKF